MEDLITISAKTLDEAITKALLELETTTEHLYYEVVQKESSGFLGLFGGKSCIIRARVMGEEEEKEAKKQKAEKEKAERAARAEAEKREKAAKEEAEKREREAKAEAERKEKLAKAEAEKKEKAARAEAERKEREAKAEAIKKEPVGKAESERTERPGKSGDSEGLESAEKAQEKTERFGERSHRKNFESRDFDRKRYGRRDGGRAENRERRPVEPRQEREPKVRQEVKMDEAVVQQKAREFLGQIFGTMGMEVSVETSVNREEGEMQVMLTGEDMGLLIGKRGQTLDSLQYLVSLVVNRETEGYLRVKLDTENYRERRKDTLETLARNISYKVKRTKRPVSLEPMNPYERRIIHSALQNDRYVVTRSEGEDPYRHVVISLKREGYGGRRERYGGRNREESKEGKES